VQAASDAAEGELATGLAVEGDVGGLYHVEKVPVPQLHLDDPPGPGHVAIVRQDREDDANATGRPPLGQRIQPPRTLCSCVTAFAFVWLAGVSLASGLEAVMPSSVTQLVIGAAVALAMAIVCLSVLLGAPLQQAPARELRGCCVFSIAHVLDQCRIPCG
jgi:hypothetical protein